MREGFKQMGEGMKQGVQFVGDQLQHPDAQKFMKNAAEIVANSDGNPMEMQMKFGAISR